MATQLSRAVTDGTVQATNTALENIDTTGQSIASAISGLGQTLGSDRALIDGSNIGNKATFRQNIGANGLSITEVDISGTTNNVGYIATGYDFNKYFIGGRFQIPNSGGVYAIFRPSAQNKVVIHFLDDTLDRLPNTAVVGKIYYLNIT